MFLLLRGGGSAGDTYVGFRARNDLRVLGISGFYARLRRFSLVSCLNPMREFSVLEQMTELRIASPPPAGCVVSCCDISWIAETLVDIAASTR